MIFSVDSQVFEFSEKQIFDTLIDFENYNMWWGKFITFNVIKVTKEILNSEIFVKPLFATGFLWKVTNFEKYKYLEISYAEGAYSGTGIWKITNNGSHNILSYEIKLIPNDMFTEILSKFVNISFIHSKMMKSTYGKLNDYLIYKYRGKGDVQN